MKMQHRGWEALKQVLPAGHRRRPLARWLRRVLRLLKRVHAPRARL